MAKLSTAVIFTGMPALMSQEIAVFDLLLKGKHFDFDQENTWLCGYSGGAICLLGINACFRSKNPLSWETDFKDFFVNALSNENTFVKTHPFYWETIPLRNKLKEFMKKAQLGKMSDLSFDTNVLVFSEEKNKTIWVGSRFAKNRSILLSDLLMATTAVPVIFPKCYIHGANDELTGIPDVKYSEGSTEGVLKKFKKNLKKQIAFNGPFGALYILSPERRLNSYTLLEQCFSVMADVEKLKLEEFFKQLGLEPFLKFLVKFRKVNKGRKFASKVFVCMPNLQKTQDLFEYGEQKLKYDEVVRWAERNPNDLVIEIDTFLAMYGL
jgi:hypothetical protein